MIDETGIIIDGWSKKLPLRQLVDKAESYLHARGVKDADDKNKDEKKQDWRKPLHIEKDKEPDLQGNFRKKHPPDGPPKLTQQQPEPEVYNWQKHVKRNISQHKLIISFFLLFRPPWLYSMLIIGWYYSIPEQRL